MYVHEHIAEHYLYVCPVVRNGPARFHPDIPAASLQQPNGLSDSDSSDSDKEWDEWLAANGDTVRQVEEEIFEYQLQQFIEGSGSASTVPDGDHQGRPRVLLEDVDEAQDSFLEHGAAEFESPPAPTPCTEFISVRPSLVVPSFAITDQRYLCVSAAMAQQVHTGSRIERGSIGSAETAKRRPAAEVLGQAGLA